jgi:YesN/AraC family two-component response regulator
MKNNSANLLILDMIMDPGIDGLDTYKKILDLHPRTKAIIVSGFSETEHVREAQRLGAGKYIKRPYTLEGLGLAIKTELKK